MGNNSDNKNTGLKVALALVSILLVVSLIAIVYIYTNPPNTQNNIETSPTENGGTSVNELQERVNELQSELDSLNSSHNDYVATHSYTNSKYEECNDTINSLRAPDLVTRLGMSDQRPFLQTPYFHVSGEVWNVGTDAATNCKLHVIIYQGAVVTEDTYINLGTIPGRDYTSVDSKVYYEGSALTDWSVTPEWD